jgi:16S rRNA (uracil1498-N3)-methyltransferase
MRCFVNPADWNEGEIELAPEESHHLLHVLRARAGQPVEIFDGEGNTGVADVVSAKGRQAILRPLNRVHELRPEVRITLVQAVPREQKMDLIIQKATELGTSRIVPLITEHGVVKLKAEQIAERRERWAKIALNAAKQCGVAWLPEITSPRRLEDFLREPGGDVLLVGALTGEPRPLKEGIAAARSRGAKSIGILVGPEGDFSAGEMEQILAVNAIPVSFGRLTLRSETAAIYALSVLSYEFVP